MGKAKDLATGASYVDTVGDGMTGNLGVGGAANGTYAITSHSSGGANLRLENDGEVGFIRLEDDGDLNIWAHGDENISFLTGTGSGTTRMNIDGSGRVTKPNQPSFRAGSSGGISTGSSISTLVLPNVKHNVGNHYNSSNYTFTCPVAGIYYFGFHGNVRDVGGNATTSVYGQIMKNGSRVGIYYSSDNPDGAWHLISGQAVVSCAANDAILVSSNANAYWDSSDWTQFYGHLLG